MKNKSNIKTRVAIKKSLKYDYLQAIDIETGNIIFGLSTQKITGKKRIEKDIKLAEDFAKKLKVKKITKIIFDRMGNKYHGRIKLIADTMRKQGINF